MAYSTKYGKVSLEHSSIGEDEPVFIFRAKDKLLPQVLSHYHQICMNSGCEDEHLNAILQRYREIKSWQSVNDIKLADTTNYGKFNS